MILQVLSLAWNRLHFQRRFQGDFFNSITDEDRAIAKEFGFRAEGAQDNLGILGGTL